MSKPSVPAAWIALFLSAPSPGSIIRFLERRTRAEEIYPSLLLSDPVPPNGLRALFPNAFSVDDRTWASPLAPRLSLAFACPVMLLWQAASPEPSWGYSLYEAGEEKLHGEEIMPVVQRSLLDRLPGARPIPALPIAWAQRRGLPIERVPGLVRLRSPVPIVDYVTVAKLDQRSLLVENVPRLYRFDPANPEGWE
jgi:hypothetical protein